MYPLLILREEIVCLTILLFLILNGRFYQMGKDSGNFLRLTLFGVGHVVFDIITVLMDNHIGEVPFAFSWVAHALFYLFAILFAYEFFCYTAQLCLSQKTVRKFRMIALILPVLYFFFLPFFDIVYLPGYGTSYGTGLPVYLAFGISLFFFASSVSLIIVYWKNIPKHTLLALIPMLTILILAGSVQLAIPEFLFTGGAVTIVTVGFFFSLENPADVFRRKVQIDALTGVKSRHSYEEDIRRIDEKYSPDSRTTYIIVFCDLNRLKAVNDLFGHLEGDNYISSVSNILQKNMKRADGIYRMGGDEFMAIYKNVPEDELKKDIENVHRDCELLTEQRNYDVGVAIGYAVSGSEYKSIREVLKVADYLMYKNKAEMKKQKAYIRDKSYEKLNITGLTDRIFDAFAETEYRTYPFICNMETNIARISRHWVEYFNLPGEFIYDFNTLWAEYIHPDDRADFEESINGVLNSETPIHNMQYRARNKNGEYIVCTCRGAVVKGKNGEPDLFAGTLINHGIAESIDPVTGLRNDHALDSYFELLIKRKTPAIILKVSIIGFNRINMLYGYSNGNELLCQFADAIKTVIREKGDLFRIEGTKFIICLPRVSEKDTSEIYDSIRAIAEHELKLTFSLIPLQVAGGAYVLNPEHFGKITSIRSSLIYAHEQSKYEYCGKLVFYRDTEDLDDSETPQSQSDYKLLSKIHQDAITDKKGFYLRYQPIINTQTGKITGGEALIRWMSKEYSEIPPAQFVPWLENDPCFFDIGNMVIRRAIADAKAIRMHIPDFVINVNITQQQLLHEDFRRNVLAALEEYDYPPEGLCLELTERCKELDIEFLKGEVEFFRGHNIRTALDDVGTGSASFALVLSLPVDEIKVDRIFVGELFDKKANRIFVRSLADAAESLGETICFEGIEDEKTYDYLKQYKNSCYQGFYFARPLLFNDFIEKIESEKQK